MYLETFLPRAKKYYAEITRQFFSYLCYHQAKLDSYWQSVGLRLLSPVCIQHTPILLYKEISLPGGKVGRVVNM